MGRTKPQLRGSLALAVIACVFISQSSLALPSRERQLGEPLLQPDDSTTKPATKAHLIHRTSGESGTARARYLRQAEAVAVSGDSALIAKTLQDQNEDPSYGTDDICKVDCGHFQTRSDSSDSKDPIVIQGGKRPYPRGHHHHSHHPDDHSRGGHSDHWSEHHGLKPAALRSKHHHHGHHHHHSRQRGKGLGPNHPIQVRDPAIGGDESVTLVAPPSAQPVVIRLPTTQESNGSISSKAPDQMAKEETVKGTEAFDGRQTLANLDQSRVERGGGVSKRAAFEVHEYPDGVPGVIDLMEGSPNGEKLGGLGASPLPPNDTMPSSISNLFALLIDSTPNLIDQATFLLRTFKDQSILEHDKLDTGALQELIVALEVPLTSDGTLPQRMCATFNPLELDVQSFGLALCMDQDSATNNRRMSQAFRYSPGTGILTPFYGAEGSRSSVLAAVNDRILALEMSEEEAPSSQPGCNGTEIYDLDPNAPTLPSNLTIFATPGLHKASNLEGCNSTYQSYPEMGPFSASHPISGTVGVKWSSMTMTTAAPVPTPLLSVNDTSVPNHPLIISGSVGETASTTGEDTAPNVVMVFRSSVESSSWRRTKQDVDAPEERQKALESYQEIGIAGKNATRLDHWAVIDKIQSKSSAEPNLKTNSGPIGKTPGKVASSGSGSRKMGAPVGYWSDSDLSGSGESEQSIDDVQSNEAEGNTDSSMGDDSPPTKPAVNVAYFADSGRSAPVPPDQQADFARPLLVADPLTKPQTASKQVANSKGLDPPLDVPRISSTSLHHGLADLSPTARVMAGMPKSRIGPLGIPIVASD